MPDTAQSYGPDVELDDPAFIHPTALIHGKVRVGKGVSIWPYTVIRAENFEVVIGEHTNIQDFTMIHVGYSIGTHIGAHCSITHRATVHGARVGDNCLVGIGATLMDNVEIGDNSIIGAGALVKEGTKVPPNSIVVGAPAKVIKTRNSWVANRWNAWIYSINGEAYAKGDHRRWDRADFVEEARHKMHALEEEFERMQDGGHPAEGDI
jgi:carbonic anhydrase/acetyltransferase-like protein (isoleucine patch superfamily)